MASTRRTTGSRRRLDPTPSELLGPGRDNGPVLVTNHVLSGAFIGRAASGVVSAFGCGVLSHLLLDAIPHWGDERAISDVLHIAVPDGLLGLTAMGVVTARTEPGLRLRVLSGMAGAAFLDLDKPSRLFFGFSPFPRMVDALHLAVQHESPRRMPQEVLVGAGASLLLVALARRRTARGGRALF